MRLFLLLSVGFVLFSTSCSLHYYTPNLIQSPYIEKKGDGTVSAAVSGSPISLNGDFHASYSPIKHGSVMLNYFNARKKYENSNFFGGPSYIQRSKGYLVEAAIGGYKPFGFGTAAVYVGMGQGQMRNDYGIDRIANLTLQRFFVQPTFTFKNDWFRLGMGLRLVRLSYPKGKIDYRIEPDDIRVIQSLEQDSPFWFPELGGNIGVHFKPVTISLNLVLIASKRTVDYGFDASNIGLGLAFELQDLIKSKPKKDKSE